MGDEESRRNLERRHEKGSSIEEPLFPRSRACRGTPPQPSLEPQTTAFDL
jgi:hypothetical protein